MDRVGMGRRCGVMPKREVQATVRIDIPVKTAVSADNLVRAVELSERLMRGERCLL